jgi:hypothetical protein
MNSIPDLSRQPALHDEAPTPIPRRSDLEALRGELDAGRDPAGALVVRALLERVDKLEAGVLEAIAHGRSLEERTSKTDIAQDARAALLAERLSALEEQARAAGASSAAAEQASTALDRRLSGWASPKVIGALAGGLALLEVLGRVLHALGVVQ